MTSNQLVPIVIEKSGRGERAYDIYSRLLKDRIILLNGAVTDETAGTIIAQMLFLSNDDPKSDIQFYINSPGGSVSAGFGIIDTMRAICAAMWRQPVSAWRHRWALPCWQWERRASELSCLMHRSCSISR